jgi:hypothetical protein
LKAEKYGPDEAATFGDCLRKAQQLLSQLKQSRAFGPPNATESFCTSYVKAPRQTMRAASLDSIQETLKAGGT